MDTAHNLVEPELHVDPALVRRIRQLRRVWHAEGGRGVATRARMRMAELVAPTRPVLPVLTEDVIAADLERPFAPAAALPKTGSCPVLAWVVVPAAPRAGGHTTLYRIVNHLQAHGYANRVYFYDVNNVDLEYYRQVLRRSYGFRGEVASTKDGIADADALIATSWQTAYPVFNARCLGKRCYFVQDFEADFYAVGSLSELALNTYRMGLHAITAGPWLAEKLRTEFGMEADSFPFGSDGDVYSRATAVPRRGVAFYARPEVARRGFEIGMMALELFAARCPDVEIHLYGQQIDVLGRRFHNHGRASPQELNGLYNRCRAGLSLSLTNTSLVPHEMLAAGCIPVVNDSPNNRIVLDNAFVRYASLTPASLAAALEEIVRLHDFDEHSAAAAASVKSATWADAGAAVERILQRLLDRQ
jgi:glycosyltransferase involved in cell wall biosynthesis